MKCSIVAMARVAGADIAQSTFGAMATASVYDVCFSMFMKLHFVPMECQHGEILFVS